MPKQHGCYQCLPSVGIEVALKLMVESNPGIANNMDNGPGARVVFRRGLVDI
jgi:hypothetical protein